MQTKIHPVENNTDFNIFLKLPLKIYVDDPYYVSPLIADLKILFDQKENPFWKYARRKLFLARQGSKVVGRISAHIADRHNEFHNEKTGFFGFFDCIFDRDVSDALLKVAEEWCEAEGMNLIRGPCNFTTNDDSGLLIDGYDGPPVIMMPYHPPYVRELIEIRGYNKAMDLIAYLFTTDHAKSESMKKIWERVARVEVIAKRRGYTLRNLNMKKFEDEIVHLRNIYNGAWEKNWGFIPLTDEEFRHSALQMKQVVIPDFGWFLEHKGKPVGFALYLPDVNEILGNAGGRLGPITLMKFLYHFKIRRWRDVKTMRVPLLGVVKEHRNRGGDTLLMSKMVWNAIEHGFERGEASWLLENNHLILSGLSNIGGKAYRRYRIYDAALPVEEHPLY